MSNKPSNITDIISAAGEPSNMIRGYMGLADTMLLINGEPLLGYISDDLINQRITRTIIAVRTKNKVTEKCANLKYANHIKIVLVPIKK